MNELDQKFLDSRQEALRLKIALERYFAIQSGKSSGNSFCLVENDTPELIERYGNYLKSRIRPAMENLISEGSLEKIEILSESIELSERNLNEFIEMAMQKKQSEILVYFLKKQQNITPSEKGSNFFREETICQEIWRLTQDTLAVRYPFFRTLLFSFSYCVQEQALIPGTDGAIIYYNPKVLIRVYRQNPEKVLHILLHMLFHKLFLHIVQTPEANPHLWDLACDIAAERLIREERAEIRPQFIYRELSEQISDLKNLEQMKNEYGADDHSFWKKADKDALLTQVQTQWNSFASGDGSEGAGDSGGRGTTPGTLTERLFIKQKKTYDFRKYLRRFAITREEMKTDLESFDYIPYLYGLARYGNLPLIEHLEYQEVHKLEELVIAIDTSGSCKTDTIRRFMEETYGILSDRENFFDRMNVYVIQADFCVQNVAHITSDEEWNAYLKDLTIHGRSGTDFRPVFAYVEELRKKKELKNLKGLLYFTDGDGIYPETPTDYETAFVFYLEKEQHQKVPSWAVTLKLEGESYEY